MLRLNNGKVIRKKSPVDLRRLVRNIFTKFDSSNIKIILLWKKQNANEFTDLTEPIIQLFKFL